MNKLVIFRQGGNNLRLGNTLVWIARAHAWCSQHGLDFHFASAARVLHPVLHEDSPLFAGCTRLAERTRDLPPALACDEGMPLETWMARVFRVVNGSKGMVTLLPGRLGCIADCRGVDWDDAAVADFFSAHDTVLVNEPHPFSSRLEVPARLLSELYAPSAATQAQFNQGHPGPSVKAGLHIRQTDYKRWQDGLHYRDNEAYNLIATSLLADLPAGSQLYIAHDGEFVAAPALAARAEVTVSSGSADSVAEDFTRLATCDALIGPTSTFTIQAARLGEIWRPGRRVLVHFSPGESAGDISARAAAGVAAATFMT